MSAGVVVVEDEEEGIVVSARVDTVGVIWVMQLRRRAALLGNSPRSSEEALVEVVERHQRLRPTCVRTFEASCLDRYGPDGSVSGRVKEIAGDRTVEGADDTAACFALTLYTNGKHCTHRSINYFFLQKSCHVRAHTYVGFSSFYDFALPSYPHHIFGATLYHGKPSESLRRGK